MNSILLFHLFDTYQKYSNSLTLIQFDVKYED